MVPKKMFFTTGMGTHKDRLCSFEVALRNAGIEKYNLVYVSSILPPKCKIVSKDQGLKFLKTGQIVYCVMSRNETNEADRLVSASIGMAVRKNNQSYGYLAEHHANGETARTSGKHAEDVAISMLVASMDSYEKLNGKIGSDLEISDAQKMRLFKTKQVGQAARGKKNGLWTTVVAAAVFILE